MKISASIDELEVYLDGVLAPRAAEPVRVGHLFHQRGRIWFRYDRNWIATPAAFNLDPRLQLAAGDFHPDATHSNFGAFLDSSPDRWGQKLMDRREQLAAKVEGRRPRALYAWDYLIGVQDLTRMGSLRFRKPGQDMFLDHHPLPAPPVADLRMLEEIASRIASREPIKDLDQLGHWLAVLVAPGASLGGARPKANFRAVDGSLWIAKFPSRDDHRDEAAWEMLVHRLAAAAGVNVPPARLEQFASPFHTFCVRRFDREANGRRVFMSSAMTSLGKQDGTEGSYLELAEFLQSRGPSEALIQEDLRQLYRRAVFNVLVGNRDDHLRNYAFILTAEGWRLSPAYDMNPSSDKETHVLLLDEATSVPYLEPVLATCKYYGLDEAGAHMIVDEVVAAVEQWRDVAAQMRISRADVEFTAPAFSALTEWRAAH